MLEGAALQRALARVALATSSGPWLRAVDAAHLKKPPPGFSPHGRPQPLWGGGAPRVGGRFTPKGSFPTLYLSSDIVTVGCEIQAVFPDGQPSQAVRDPFTVIQILGQLTNVLDLTRPGTRRSLKTTVEELISPWLLQPSPPTHLLARAAHASGRVLAIRAPSAANPREGTITAVFVELLPRFSPSFLEVSDSTLQLHQRLPDRSPGA
jgi:RES domain-containing protein